MGEVLGALEVMVDQVLVGVMTLALVLAMVGQGHSMVVEEVTEAVVVTTLMQDRFMTKLFYRCSVQV